MAVWLSVACGILAVAGIALFVKLMIVRRSERELLKEFSEILAADTNRLITLSAGSGYLKSLAAELNRQLSCLRAERLRYERGDAELKDTISNISHDLRTPLTAISGYLELLEGEEVSPDVKRYLSIVSDRVAVLKELAEEFFRYSVDGAGIAHRTRFAQPCFRRKRYFVCRRYGTKENCAANNLSAKRSGALA